MGIANLFNKNKKIGTVKSYDQAIKSMVNKKHKLITTLVLTANIIASTLTGCAPKEEKVTDNSYSIESFSKDLQEIINGRLYVVNLEDTEQLVNTDYLNANEYVPLDDINTRHVFITDSLRKLSEMYPDKSNQIDTLYLEYLYLYNNYNVSDIKNAYYTKKYVEQEQDYYIAEIEKVYGVKYYPNAIPYSEYIKKQYDNTKMNVTIEVKEKDTLSNIVNSYADNKTEYKQSMGWAMLNNEFIKKKDDYMPDFDYIQAGQKLNLTNVGKEDLDVLGLEEDDQDILGMISYIYKYREGIHVLAGDWESFNNNKKIVEEISEYVELFESNKYDQEQFAIKLRNLCNDIYLLTGKEYQPPIVNKKSR